MTTTAGKRWIKTASILMLILGIGGIIVAVAGIVGYSQMDAAMVKDMETLGISVAGQRLQMTVTAAISLLEVVAALIGLVSMNDPERGRLCLVTGALLILCHLGNMVYGAVLTGFSAVTLVSFVLAVLFPFIYCVGGFKNMKAAR